MVNRRLYWLLENRGLLCEEQSGFRSASRTEGQLLTLCQKIQDGFQDGSHTTAIFVDLQLAYYRVWRKGLLLKIQRLGINGNLYRWIKSFLYERTIQTKFEDKLSSHHTLEEGIPQGSALSCTLFLIYINDLAKEVRCNKALYADDLVIWHTHRYARQSARYINLDLERLQKYCDTWKITTNTNKTSYSIFTHSPKVTKQNPNIRLLDQQLKKEEHPSYLGVQLDPRLNLKKT
ncbi:RNA-directed DNA polymerase from mobile element jockey [Elysia marginata]|uniref:RNA-directed DNA polymerase from mobile element jockey n=1 Tax=Elysia marginata TaxID=1093978 RepID=A0AAV4EC24_9GAST|nr:RNA-directed DNA polymerase from mobile element jockey [Elysia marginata]